MSQFKNYRRKVTYGELRAYVPGETLPETISISMADRALGHPKEGDMIARNPDDHADQWLVSAEYFAANYEPGPEL